MSRKVSLLEKNDVEVFFEVAYIGLFVNFCGDCFGSVGDFKNFIDLSEMCFDGIR